MKTTRSREQEAVDFFLFIGASAGSATDSQQGRATENDNETYDKDTIAFYSP